MHPNKAFHDRSAEDALAFALSRGFGALTAAAPEGAPLMSHIPFCLDEEGVALEFHLVRSNPLARLLAEGERPVLMAVSGPDGYVSPDWYQIGPDQAPTWNYVAVHLRGAARLAPAERLRDHLDRLSAAFEERLRPKPPWSTAKMSETAYQRMARMIVPARMTIESVESTWKLGQNKPVEARLSAAATRAEIPGLGLEAAALAALMRGEE